MALSLRERLFGRSTPATPADADPFAGAADEAAGVREALARLTPEHPLPAADAPGAAPAGGGPAGGGPAGGRPPGGGAAFDPWFHGPQVPTPRDGDLASRLGGRPSSAPGQRSFAGGHSMGGGRSGLASRMSSAGRRPEGPVISQLDQLKVDLHRKLIDRLD